MLRIANYQSCDPQSSTTQPNDANNSNWTDENNSDGSDGGDGGDDTGRSGNGGSNGFTAAAADDAVAHHSVISNCKCNYISFVEPPFDTSAGNGKRICNGGQPSPSVYTGHSRSLLIHFRLAHSLPEDVFNLTILSERKYALKTYTIVLFIINTLFYCHRQSGPIVWYPNERLASSGRPNPPSGRGYRVTLLSGRLSSRPYQTAPYHVHCGARRTVDDCQHGMQHSRAVHRLPDRPDVTAGVFQRRRRPDSDANWDGVPATGSGVRRAVTSHALLCERRLCTALPSRSRLSAGRRSAGRAAGCRAGPSATTYRMRRQRGHTGRCHHHDEHGFERDAALALRLRVAGATF